MPIPDFSGDHISDEVILFFDSPVPKDLPAVGGLGLLPPAPQYIWYLPDLNVSDLDMPDLRFTDDLRFDDV